ncbi:protein of unknown function DUF1961 [Paenibacillus algicola]|uniref:DUF1961 family protein n=1 Tax=Paenibacillus algicola TaxID=2565926 RepID=A0A4P8XGH9_9BACL|nr:DUF1961 family protein [Paenibacillus algicola]QCT01597.1 protein of unknown function DUF1961 [Paenibacillus algicola]
MDLRKRIQDAKPRLIYSNPLQSAEDTAGFVLEGSGKLCFEQGRMRMEPVLPPSEGQRANYVLWCDQIFPADMLVTWTFRPLSEKGLAMLFFAAEGKMGEDVLDARLRPRTGEYEQYYDGDFNTYHVSYFRRNLKEERALHTCNLRKSAGFHLVKQGADPIPNAADIHSPLDLALLKRGAEIAFFINDLEVFHFHDDGVTYGDVLKGGRIGFRQMSPLIAEYSNLQVYALGESLASDEGDEVQYDD